SEQTLRAVPFNSPMTRASRTSATHASEVGSIKTVPALAVAANSFAHLPQNLPRDFTVVEVVFRVADDLIIFVAFARDQNDVAAARLGEGKGDRGAAVRLDTDFGGNGGIGLSVHAGQNLFNDGLRVFAARIVGGHDGDLGLRRGETAHDRAFGAVAIAAAA